MIINESFFFFSGIISRRKEFPYRIPLNMVPKTKVKRTVSIKGKLTSAIFISYFTVFQTKVKYSHDFPISPLLYSAAYPTGALGVPCSCPHLHFPKHTFSSLLPGEDFMEIHAPLMEGGGCHWPKDFSNMRVQLRPDLKDFL